MLMSDAIANPSRQILVHEKQSFWTAEIERRLAGWSDVQIRWRPYQDDLLLEAKSATLILLACECNDQSLDLLRQLKGQAPGSEVCFVVRDLCPDWEWLARELGAGFVLADTTSKDRVVWSIERLLTFAETFGNVSSSSEVEPA